MTIRPSTFLPGVPEQLVRTALAKAGGNEIDSGKLISPSRLSAPFSSSAVRTIVAPMVTT